MRFAPSEQSWLGKAARLSWRPLLSTAEQRFAGPGVELAVLRSDGAIDLPPRCACLWAAEERSSDA